jgi:hypothetical protein
MIRPSALRRPPHIDVRNPWRSRILSAVLFDTVAVYEASW